MTIPGYLPNGDLDLNWPHGWKTRSGDKRHLIGKRRDGTLIWEADSTVLWRTSAAGQDSSGLHADLQVIPNPPPPEKVSGCYALMVRDYAGQWWSRHLRPATREEAARCVGDFECAVIVSLPDFEVPREKSNG